MLRACSWRAARATSASRSGSPATIGWASSPRSRASPSTSWVADTIGRELGWDGARLALELERFAEEAAAEGIAADVERPDEEAAPVAGPSPASMP